MKSNPKPVRKVIPLIIDAGACWSDDEEMNNMLTPPTDNLYKFAAIGGLAFVLASMVLMIRQQHYDREEYVAAQIELSSAGYVDNGIPPADRDLRRCYFRREFALDDAQQIVRFAGGLGGKVLSGAILVSVLGFFFWFVRLQRFEEMILTTNARKLALELRGDRLV